jgi:hypothetical protein
MLIAKPLAVGDVVALKQLNGPDIVARLAEVYKTGDEAVVVRRPIEAHPVNSGGGLALAFAPFSLCASDDQVFRIPRSALMVDPFPARSEITTTYNEQTTSLKLPK